MKKIYFIKKKNLYQQSQSCQSYQDFFFIVPVDVVFFVTLPYKRLWFSVFPLNFKEKVQLNAPIPLRHFKKSRLGFNGW
jgi:hypothetical protein